MRDGLLYKGGGGDEISSKIQIIKSKEGVYTKMSCFTPNKKNFDRLI
jgi:hypothetical protein